MSRPGVKLTLGGEEDEGIAMASEVLMTISKDEEERIRMIKQEMNVLDWQSDLALARSEGFEKGEQKGMRRILNLLKDGKSPEEIMKMYTTDYACTTESK